MSNAWLFIAKLFEAMHCIYLKQYVVKQNVPKDPHTWSGPGSGTARNPRTNNAMYSCFNNHLVLNRDLITWVIDPLFLHFRKIYEMWWFWFSFTHKGTALIPAIACGTAFGIWGIPLTVEPAVVISVSDSGGETAGSVFCKKGVTQGVRSTTGPWPVLNMSQEGDTVTAAAAAPAAEPEVPAEPVKEMRTITLTGYGGLKNVKCLNKPEVSPKEGEVLVRVRAW